MSETEPNLETNDPAPAAPAPPVFEPQSDLPPADAKPSGPTPEERGFQRQFNKLSDSLSPIKAYLDNPQLGGARGLATILSNTEKVWANPEIAAVLQEYLVSGKVAFPKAKDSSSYDDFQTPEETPAWKQELARRDAEIAGLRNMLHGVQKNVGMRGITDHTAKFLREYPMTPDEKARFEDAMDQRIDRLSSTPQGLQVLQSMGWDDYRSMGLVAIEDFRDAISERKRNQQRAANAGRATDAPGVSTGGDEARPTQLPRNRAELSQMAKRALRAVQG